jgi:hypothetical protein
MPSPRTGVLIGASTGAVTLDDFYFSRLMSELENQHAKHGGSFLVTTSRRTPPDRIFRLRTAFSRWPGLFWGGTEDGANPYAGILAWSDRIVVSPDSVNMISEACATGKPVCAFAGETSTGKLAEFQRTLVQEGYLLDPTSESTPKALRETGSVAAQLRARIERRRPIQGHSDQVAKTSRTG